MCLFFLFTCLFASAFFMCLCVSAFCLRVYVSLLFVYVFMCLFFLFTCLCISAFCLRVYVSLLFVYVFICLLFKCLAEIKNKIEHRLYCMIFVTGLNGLYLSMNLKLLACILTKGLGVRWDSGQ